MGFWCKLLGHRWEGCRCARCGETRNEGHRWVEAEDKCEHTCALCGLTETVPHTWFHCRCERCGQTRDSHHLWLAQSPCEQVCRVCGKVQAEHDWRQLERGVDRCKVCGKLHRLTEEEIAGRDEQWTDTDRDADFYDALPDDLPDPD